jgi:UrcA family protein
VGYKDIDITTSLGEKVLKQRIADAAKAACQEIQTLYPNRLIVTSKPECERAAIDRAMVQADAAIAAAEKATHK